MLANWKNASVIGFIFFIIVLIVCFCNIHENLNTLDTRLIEGFKNHNLYFSAAKESFLEHSCLELHPTTVALYQAQSSIRKNALKDLIDNDTWLILYNVLVPEVFCKDLVRIGTVVDGGKWVCNPIRVKNFETCTVYSMGVKDEPSFEVEFAKFTQNKCSIRSFDRGDQNSETLEKIENANGVFMKALISAETNTSADQYNMRSLMDKFEDKKIDILKIDIEGFEYKILDELTTIPMCQILIEVHGRTPTRTLELLQKISLSGYYLFSYEINGSHHTLSEYSFIHESCLEQYGVNTIFGRYLS